MSILHKVLGIFGLQPKAMMGYRTVRVFSREGKLGTVGSGDYHEKYDRPKLLDLSREFYRNNAIYRGMIRRAASYIVGRGFGLQAKTDDPEWNARAEAVWRRFWRRPEIRQNMSGCSVERMVARELLLTNEFAAVKTTRRKLQLIEPEQVAGPAMQDDGIKRDAAGTPISYNVCPYSTAGGPQYAKGQAVPAESMLFGTDPERPTSCRGIPPAQASFPNLERIDDVCNSEALAMQILSRLALSITRSGGAAAAFNESEVDDTKDARDGDVAPRVQFFEQGIIFNGEVGEEIKGIERNVPGKDFTANLTTFLRLLGLALGLPLEFVMLDWTKSNYSQCRAILEQAQQTFLDWQDILEGFFHRPAYEWAIQLAIDAGELRMRDDWDAHEWIRSPFPWIDQLKEAQAYGLQVDRGFITHATVLKAKGQDRGEFLAQRKREVIEAQQVALEIKAETGIETPWQPFAGMETPQAVAPAASPAAAEPDPASNEDQPAEGRKVA